MQTSNNRSGIQTCWSTQSSWHAPHQIQSSKKPKSFKLLKHCLAVSLKRLLGLWRPSVDRFDSELVSWCEFSFGQILFFPLFPIGVFRGGRQWLLRVVVSEESLCESQSRTNSEPVVIHLRFGSWARPEGHLWWNSNLKMARFWSNQLAPAESTDAVVRQWAKWTLELLELGHTWPYFQISPIPLPWKNACHGVPR